MLNWLLFQFKWFFASRDLNNLLGDIASNSVTLRGWTAKSIGIDGPVLLVSHSSGEHLPKTPDGLTVMRKLTLIAVKESTKEAKARRTPAMADFESILDSP